MDSAAKIAAEAGGIGGYITALGHEPHHYTIFYVDVDDEMSWQAAPRRGLGAESSQETGKKRRTLVCPYLLVDMLQVIFYGLFADVAVSRNLLI